MIKDIPISQIKPDPNQPRKSKWKKDIEEFAENIKQHGIINPIEIDEHNIIITGELRFLSAKLLNLKVVPCKIIAGLKPEARFLRQLSENVHQHTMEPFEEAKAYKKAIESHFQGGGRPPLDDGVRWLAKEIGKNRDVISERLALLRQSKEFQRAVRGKDVPASAVRIIERSPDKHKEAMEKKVLAGEAGTRDAALQIARRLKDRPDAAKRILKEDFTGMDQIQVSKKLHEIAPTEAEDKWNDQDYFEKLNQTATRLSELILLRNPFKKGKVYDSPDAISASIELQELLKTIPMWLHTYNQIEIHGHSIVDAKTGELID